MAQLDAREAADAAKDLVGRLGALFMFDPLTRESGKLVGLRGKPQYHLGRGGALGDVPAEVVAAAFAFWSLDVVREHWEAGRAVMSPRDGALHYAECAAETGRRVFADLAEAPRLVELVEKVVDGADAAGLPLFAGWRALPRPGDAPGRLQLVLHLLRELRGAIHVAAVGATALTGLQAVMAGPYGENNARFFDWPPPYPDPEPYRARWDAAEELTAASTAQAFLALSPQERAELVSLLQAAAAAADAAAG